MTYSHNSTTNIRYAFQLGEINDTKLTATASKESGACRFKDIELFIMSFTIHRNKRKKIKKTLRYTLVTYSKNNTANVKCAFLL